MRRAQAGFTLTELMTTVVVASVLTSILIPSFAGARDKAQNSRVQSNVRVLQTALEQYGVDHAGNYPGAMDDLFTAEYVRGNRYPENPWGRDLQQVEPIPADTEHEAQFVYGPGRQEIPTDVQAYGAIGYAPRGALEGYTLSGTGKQKTTAILIAKITR